MKTRLNERNILYAQFAIQQERNLASLTQVLEHIPLKEVREYLREINNGDIIKKRYYESAKDFIGKPDYNLLKRNFLNFKNRAYMEFLNGK